jgi:hypothetical protein
MDEAANLGMEAVWQGVLERGEAYWPSLVLPVSDKLGKRDILAENVLFCGFPSSPRLCKVNIGRKCNRWSR